MLWGYLFTDPDPKKLELALPFDDLVGYGFEAIPEAE
jgi:hypothetical protein